MYNRYIPQPDGSFQRSRMQEKRPRQPENCPPPPPPPKPPRPEPPCQEHHPPEVPPCQGGTSGG